MSARSASSLGSGYYLAWTNGTNTYYIYNNNVKQTSCYVGSYGEMRVYLNDVQQGEAYINDAFDKTFNGESSEGGEQVWALVCTSARKDLEEDLGVDQAFAFDMEETNDS